MALIIKLSIWFFCLLVIYFYGLSAVYAAAHVVERQNLFDWYYSAVFGTGAYRIGERDVFVITVPFDKQLRAASEEKYEVMLRLPITAGFYDYKIEDIGDLEIPTDVATLTFFPGIYYVIPLFDNWTVKPFANLGYGKEFEGGEEAWIYSTGARILFKTHNNDWRYMFGSSFYYAGNTRESETALGFLAFDISADVGYKTSWQIDNEQIYVGGYVTAYYFSDLDFIQSDQTTIEINQQYEIGLTFSANKSINLLGLDIERIGLGYLKSNAFYAWRLVFSFPY